MADTRTLFEAFDNLTRRHALLCSPPEGIATEDIVLSVGKIIGNQNVRAASKMNKKIVVFVSDEKFVHDVVSTGLTTETSLYISFANGYPINENCYIKCTPVYNQ